MTKYRIDRVDCVITGAYAGPLAKGTALHHTTNYRQLAIDRNRDDVQSTRWWFTDAPELTLMWTVMTLPNVLDAFRPNNFILLVDRCAESGPNVELCDSDRQPKCGN